MPQPQIKWWPRLYDMILGVIVGFDIPVAEAIVAAILTTAIVKALLKVKNH